VVDTIRVTVPGAVGSVVVTVPGAGPAVSVGIPGIPGPPPSDAALAAAVEAYLIANPIESFDPDDIAAYFEDYPLVASSIEWGDDPRPQLIFENGLI
jgi:hypothetical protein